MKTRRRLIALAIFTTALVFATAALAQPAPVSPTGPTLTTTTAIVTMLSMLLGVLTNWIQTGTLLGRWVSPQAWLPDLTMISTALGGFLGYVMSQSPVSLSATNLFYGTMAAIAALIAGVTPAGAVFVHGVLNKHTADMKRMAKTIATMAAAASALLLIAALGSTTTACKIPVAPIFNEIVNTVEADLIAGKSDDQIASDVCADLGGTVTTDAACANVTQLIQDAVTLLIDTGVLSGSALDHAKAFKTAHVATTTTTTSINGSK